MDFNINILADQIFQYAEYVGIIYAIIVWIIGVITFIIDIMEEHKDEKDN